MDEKSHQNLIGQLKNAKILIYAIIGALIIGMVGLANSIKGLDENINSKDYEISVLTTELGDLKQENVYLYNNLLLNRNLVSKSFDVLRNSFFTFTNAEEENINNLKSSFDNAKNELITLISEKEYAIDQLRKKNGRLALEVEFQQYDEGIIHILILGINQGLTDTIILSSINPEKETITLISVPRDLFINGRKINSIYQSYGIEKIKKDLHTVTGIYADEYVIISFEGFRGMIDAIGGIDLYVYEDIYDRSFPTADNGYKVYSIKKGSHHMDGSEALMYARSRKSTSDFDRSKRQQQVIQAIRVKLKMLNLLDDLDIAIDLFKLVVSSIQTDIDMFEALYYLNNFQNYAIESGNVLSTGNYLYPSKTVDGQYILLPKSGDYYDIKKEISALIKN